MKFKNFRRIEIFPPLNKVQLYRIKCTLVLTSVPLICAIILSTVLYYFAELDLYFLETGGLIVNEAIRQAYFDQVMMEFGDIWQMLLGLWVATFIISWMVMGWAIAPFMQGEKILKAALEKKEFVLFGNFWLSESPTFTKIVAGLGRRVGDPTFPFDGFPEAAYRFNFRFFLKFLGIYYVLSVMTGYVLSTVFDAVYLKNVSLAITLIKMRQYGHFFLAQEEILHSVTIAVTTLSSCVYLVIGIYVSRYLSNMIFVFSRAIREKHFPLKLRDSDVYHAFAARISETAETAGLSKPAR